MKVYYETQMGFTSDGMNMNVKSLNSLKRFINCCVILFCFPQ